jgi:hypothetical protein
LGPCILLRILFSNTPNLCSFLSVRDQTSHSYKHTNFNLYIFGAFPKFNLLLIFSWIQFWHFTIAPKYLNSSTFSNDLYHKL